MGLRFGSWEGVVVVVVWLLECACCVRGEWRVDGAG